MKLETQELAEDQKWLDENLEAIKEEETFSSEEVMRYIIVTINHDRSNQAN